MQIILKTTLKFLKPPQAQDASKRIRASGDRAQLQHNDGEQQAGRVAKSQRPAELEKRSLRRSLLERWRQETRKRHRSFQGFKKMLNNDSLV